MDSSSQQDEPEPLLVPAPTPPAFRPAIPDYIRASLPPEEIVLLESLARVEQQETWNTDHLLGLNSVTVALARRVWQLERKQHNQNQKWLVFDTTKNTILSVTKIVVVTQLPRIWDLIIWFSHLSAVIPKP